MERSKKEQSQFHFFKKQTLNLPNVPYFLFFATCFVIAISFYIVYPRSNFISYGANNQEQNKTESTVPSRNGSKKCDLFKGRWLPDARGPLYTNYSCTTIPASKNCFLHGRKDTDFLNWRWKPDQCDLPRFDPGQFLSILRGKTLAFVGDSVARNQMESLLCLLSAAETPTKTFEDGEEKSTTWEFRNHNFTLMALRSNFLVTATEQAVNGSVTGNSDLHLDRIDTNWFANFENIDYAIFSVGHWFLRPNDLYDGDELLGRTYGYGAPNATNLEPDVTFRRVFRAAFEALGNCHACRKSHILLSTFSSSHFEGGDWNTGGDCIKTRPYGKDEVVNWGDLRYRNVQVEEFESGRNVGGKNGNIFLGVLDITEMMIMRGDGHPGRYWKDDGANGYKDCVHYCLPGPIDTWNEILLEILKRSIVSSIF